MEERIDMKISAVLLLQQSTNDLFVQRPFWLSRKEKMIRASSERAVRHGGSLRATLSCASLASSGLFTGTLMSRRSRSASLSPTPKSKSHGRQEFHNHEFHNHGV